MTGCGDLRILGHLSCPERFRRDVEALQPGGPILIRIPLVTPSLMSITDAFLRRIAAWDQVELSINDWGTLYKCAEMRNAGMLRASLTAGVLLAGQATDPILAEMARNETESFRDALRTPSITACVPLLKQLRVDRVTFCAQALPFPDEPFELGIDYCPNSVVSVFPCGGDCEHCGTGNVRWGERGGRPLYRRHNLLLSDGCLPEKLRAQDRLLALLPPD